MLFFSEVLLISVRKICISPSSGSVFLIMHKNFTKKRDLKVQKSSENG